MRWQVSSLAALMAALLTAWTCRAAAQGATGWSTDVAEGDTTPQKQNTNVAVVFEPSAADLPQAAIRDAIARELGTPPDRTVLAARRELSIGVEASELVVRFASQDGRTERRVALPDDASQTPELLRLIAGNLARDQRPVLELASATASHSVPHVSDDENAGTTTPSDGSIRHVSALRRHWLGLQVAQDFSYEPGTFVCDAGAAGTTYSCYSAGTSTPYTPSAQSSLRSVPRGFSVATTRLLATYDYALSPAFTVGGRLGVAFRGGPPGADSSSGVKGTPFFPAHLEVRGTWWFAPLTNQRLRGFLGVGAGMAQIDAKTDYGVTCPSSNSDASDGCTGTGTPPSSPRVLDVWRKVGRGFVAARVGTELRLWDEVGVALDVNVLTAFPAFGVAIEPTFGVVYGL